MIDLAQRQEKLTASLTHEDLFPSIETPPAPELTVAELTALELVHYRKGNSESHVLRAYHLQTERIAELKRRLASPAEELGVLEPWVSPAWEYHLTALNNAHHASDNLERKMLRSYWEREVDIYGLELKLIVAKAGVR